MESWQIRHLESGDLALMRGLLDCFGEAFEDTETYCAAQPDDAYLTELLGSESFFAVVAVDRGRVVGGIAGYELRKFEQQRSELYIYDLAVRADHRRKGIATELIGHVRQLARERGAWVVYVQADLGDEPAIELYTRVGTREDVLHFDIPPGDAVVDTGIEVGAALGGPYRIVPASPEHVPALPAIERSAATLFRNAVPEELLEHVTPESDLLDAQTRGMLWVALGPDDEPVGFARVVAAGKRAHLAELDVLPSHGRRGIGSALVRTVEDWADSRKFEEITLTTYRDLPWNAPFYAKLGFEMVAENEWDADMRFRLEEEAGLESERARRVVMRRRRDPA